MRIYDLKEYVYDLVARYFVQANICWSSETSTKQTLPLVMLTFRNLNRHPYPAENIGEDELVKCYPSSITLEVDIFSKGGKTAGGYSDDTLADMNEFLLYLESPEITDELFMNNLDIQTTGPAQAIPQLLGEAKNEFRSMVELTVSFTQYAAGAYGIKKPKEELQYKGSGIWAVADSVEEEEWKPTSAGGGTYGFATEENEIITNAEAKEVER